MNIFSEVPRPYLVPTALVLRIFIFLNLFLIRLGSSLSPSMLPVLVIVYFQELNCGNILLLISMGAYKKTSIPYHTNGGPQGIQRGCKQWNYEIGKCPFTLKNKMIYTFY